MRGALGACVLAAFLVTATTQPAAGGPLRPIWQRTIVVQPLERGVQVRLHGRWVPLSGRRVVRLPARIDATRGKVRITVAAPDGPALETADLSEGEFVVTQDDATAGTPARTRARLVGGGVDACVPPWSARPAVYREGRRRLRIRKTGRIVTDDRYSITAGEGTAWLVTEECDHSRVDVLDGRVTSTPKEGTTNQTLEDVLMPGDMYVYSCSGPFEVRRCFAVLVIRREVEGRVRDFIQILAAARTSETQLTLCVTPPGHRPAMCGTLQPSFTLRDIRAWSLACNAYQGVGVYRVRWIDAAGAPFGPVLPVDVLNPEPPIPEDSTRVVNCQVITPPAGR